MSKSQRIQIANTIKVAITETNFEATVEVFPDYTMFSFYMENNRSPLKIVAHDNNLKIYTEGAGTIVYYEDLKEIRIMNGTTSFLCLSLQRGNQTFRF